MTLSIYCCSLIGLDDIHFKSKYLGFFSVLLQLMLMKLAFGIVDSENNNNWLWFCRYYTRSFILCFQSPCLSWKSCFSIESIKGFNWWSGLGFFKKFSWILSSSFMWKHEQDLQARSQRFTPGDSQGSNGDCIWGSYASDEST